MARKRNEMDPRTRALYYTGILIVVAAVLTVGVIIAMQRTWQAISARREFLVQPARVTLSSPWVRAEEMQKDFLRTDRRGVLRANPSIFTPNLTLHVQAAYGASPWVREVVAVRKKFPNELDVQLDLREPFALVRHGNQRYCVDADGMVLHPQLYLLTEDRLASLKPEIIVPATVRRPGAVGQIWTEPALREGLAMLRLYRAQFHRRVAIEAIQLVPESAAGTAVPHHAWLILSGGQRVYWGRTPAGPVSPAEIPTLEKAAVLLAFVKKEQANLPLYRTIDVRWNPPKVER